MKPLEPPFTLRTMQKHDLPACQLLKEQLIWNQTLHDWERFLSYNPTGCFVAEMNHRIVGTVCTIAYQDKFGWVAMVIVDNRHRRLGIGKALLLAGIQHLRGRGLTVKLDATPEGKMLYDTLGFVDEYHAARMTVKNANLPEPQHICHPITPNDWDGICCFDQEAFGASRQQVLESYFTRYPNYSFLIRENDEITGYITARDGSFAFHPGPWVAKSPDAAVSLLCHLIQKRKPENMVLDVLDDNAAIHRFLKEHQFEQQRPLIRMVLGENLHPGRPEWIYGMSGPELG